jgi:hypothetical protein
VVSLLLSSSKEEEIHHEKHESTRKKGRRQEIQFLLLPFLFFVSFRVFRGESAFVLKQRRRDSPRKTRKHTKKRQKTGNSISASAFFRVFSCFSW